MLPKRLVIGDIIGTISPSGPVKEKSMEKFNAGIDFFKNIGFKVKVAKNALSNTLKYSATPGEKAEDLNAMFTDDEIKAIVCSQGGSNSNSILPLINFEIIKKNPKIFLGISDITVLLNAIYHKTGMITFHGSDLMWRLPGHDKEAFLERFVYENFGNINKTSEWKTVREGISEGILIGGNLNCITKLLAMPEYCPDFENKILFLEDYDKSTSPEQVDGCLHILKQQKVFEKISGLWLGHYDHESKIPYEEIIMNVVKDYDFPILKCDDFGHNTPNTVIPIGIKARLDANNKQITLLERCVE